MQLALAAGSTDRGTVPDVSPTTRANRLLAAGVALAGAGVIAVNPVAPLIPMAGHQPAVQLTNTTAENWENLMDLISANPDPIGKAFGELSDYYGGVAQNSFEESAAGIEGIWSGHGAAKGLETILPLMSEYIQEGDYTNAYNLLNNDMLFDMLNVFQPLFNHVPYQETEEVPGVFGLGADMTRVFANVQDIFGDFSFWKSTAKYLTEPFIGMQFALADNLTDHPGHEAQDPIDALLNGYVPWDVPDGSDSDDPHGAFIGLLTERGTLAYLFDTFPQKIADALTQGLPADDVDVPVDDGGVGDALATDGLFDWADGLFS